MPLRGVYIPHFDQISVKISVLGSYTLTVAPMGVKCGMEEGTGDRRGPSGPFSMPNFTLIGATVQRVAPGDVFFMYFCACVLDMIMVESSICLFYFSDLGTYK